MEATIIDICENGDQKTVNTIVTGASDVGLGMGTESTLVSLKALAERIGTRYQSVLNEKL